MIVKLRDQNDEIQRLGHERSGLYRKCRLEEIKLPLVSGNLKNVPMEEVRRFPFLPYRSLLFDNRSAEFT